MTKVAAVTSKSAKRLLDFQQNNGYLNDVRLESFGFFLDDYVIYGGDLTFDTVDVYKVLLSESIISLNDQLWRAFIKEFRITKHNTTYYVGFLDEKGYVFGETEPFENYLRLWTIPVDANGNIGSLIDHRSLFGYLKFKAKYDGVYLNVDEVNEAINNANSAAANANQAASDVQSAVDEAKRAAEQANEAVVATEEALENFNSSLNQLEEAVVDAHTAIGETKTATTNANQAAQAADSARNNLSNAVSEKLNEVDGAIESANDAATVATQAAENIKGWGLAVAWNATTTFEKNNIVTDNGSTWQAKKQNTNSRPSLNNADWILIAQRGVDGTGAVSSVNGKYPDENGNVELDIQQGTVQKVNGKSPDSTGEVTLVASDLGEMSGDQLTPASVSLAKLAQDVQDAIKSAGGNSFFFPHALPTTIENQKSWDLPTNSYDAATDSLLVFHNGGILDNESWTVIGDAGSAYTLAIPDNPISEIEDNNVLIIVLKNASSEVPESFSGTLLTPGSVGLEKMGQDVQDAINNAGEKIEIVNDVTTGGADKAASAETVKTLNTNQAQHGGKIASNTQLGHIRGSDTLTIRPDGTAHAKQVEIVDNTIDGGRTKAASAETVKVLQSEVDSALKVNTYNATSVTTNLGDSTFHRNFGKFFFTSDIVSEGAKLTFQAASIGGQLRLKVSSYYNKSESSGGADIIYNIGFYGGSLTVNTMDIVSMSTQFANNFYVQPLSASSGKIILIIYKRQRNNPLAIEMEYISPLSGAENVLKDVIAEQIVLDNVISNPIQQSIFTHVGNSKQDLATAITGKGVPTSADATFATMVANIDAIPAKLTMTGTKLSPPNTYNFKFAKGTNTVYQPYISIEGIPFEPKIIRASSMTLTGNGEEYSSLYIGEDEGLGVNLSRHVSGFYGGATATGQSTYLMVASVTSLNGKWTVIMPVPIASRNYKYTIVG